MRRVILMHRHWGSEAPRGREKGTELCDARGLLGKIALIMKPPSSIFPGRVNLLALWG